MSTEDSWLCTPLAVYDEIFGKYGLLGNEKFCCLIEEAVAANLSRIPVINVTPLDSIPDGHLVCVQGMVQDMFNMELFMDDFRVNTADSLNRRSFRFRDFDSLQLDDAEDPSGVHFSERQSLYIVPVPGESSWVQSISFSAEFCPIKPSRQTNLPSDKIHFIVLNEYHNIRLSRCKYVPCPTEVGVKRSIFPKNEDMPTEAKKAKGRETSSSKLKPGKQFPLSEEEEDETKVGVLVRVYDEMKDVLKINELVQVYGILEHARLGSFFPPEDFAPEGKGPEPIPRVHSIVLKRLRHINPLLMETASLTTPLEPSFPKVLTESADRLRTSSAREDLFTSLLECFKGDALTAEYTLLHLVSSGISSDQTADSPYPNNLPALNIVCPLTVDHGATTGGVVKSTENPSSLLVNRLRLLLPCLVTQFAPIKLTLESLNTGPSLMPIRDAAKGALDAGRLQLPDGTEVFVDETDMTVGQLQPRGLLSFRALSLLATQQRVPYDFQFYSQDWKTECRVLIISTGPSLIKVCSSRLFDSD
ncbi:hypothetical protein PHET_09261 [Paragonimus heterotremus]|uniref:Mini-chromosome maintenance complex-binding protein n=1 Tax=Paragonimus heterotremus TaxID=100268 RepID=A0A8J4WEY0_9TREM|nr:hypothetical protein PHET_09261 [Paragonimus heterotremus]